ncbi:hypothetical protein AB0399_14515 [Streptomyces sp. NPDC088194]|uniref:hypothetical protein n=1 Tax=Streptomyces sp. NPDC088194 TaxID=3154931 RepID=UPI00344D48BE
MRAHTNISVDQGSSVTLFYEDLAYGDLCGWAGAEHVERADPDVIRDWDLPDADKAS